MAIKILVNNIKCKLEGDIRVLHKTQKAFKIKHPNAFFLKSKGYVQREWDGNIDYITERYFFKTGLLPMVYKHLVEEHEQEVVFEDHRKNFDEILVEIPETIGGLTPRPYQKNAIRAVVENHIDDFYFPMGVINAATNAGKTLIAAGIYLSYMREIPALMLINDGQLYDQFKKEMPELLGHKDVGFIRGKKDQQWGQFTVAMVQTLSRDVNKYSRELSKFGIILVDEADLGDSKSYKKIMTKCTNTNVRVGLSGSIYLSKLKKHLTKNMNLRSYFSGEVFKITKKEMVDKGFSTKIIIRVTRGSEKPPLGKGKHNWKAEYDMGITYNETRALKVAKRLEWNAKLNRLPALVICQFHDHVDLMYNIITQYFGNKYRIEKAHHKTKNRKQIMDSFRKGGCDILITTFIVKRGKNFPLTKLLINAAGSDSQSTVIQLMGRLERKDETKKKAYMEDFFDNGTYLGRHSKHRVIYYKKEGFKVIESYKK